MKRIGNKSSVKKMSLNKLTIARLDREEIRSIKGALDEGDRLMTISLVTQSEDSLNRSVVYYPNTCIVNVNI